MTNSHDPSSIIAVAGRLQESMADLKDELYSLRKYGKRNRHYIVGLAISLIFDVLLTGVVVIIAINTSAATDLANANRQAQIDTCNSGNAARKTTRDLWNYVLDASAKDPQNQTPERTKRIADFRTYMENSYAARDCADIGR